MRNFNQLAGIVPEDDVPATARPRGFDGAVKTQADLLDDLRDAEAGANNWANGHVVTGEEKEREKEERARRAQIITSALTQNYARGTLQYENMRNMALDFTDRERLTLTEQLQTLRDQVAAYEARNRAIDAEIDARNDRIDTIDTTVAAAQTEIDAAKQTEENLTEAIDADTQRIEQQNFLIENGMRDAQGRLIVRDELPGVEGRPGRTMYYVRDDATGQLTSIFALPRDEREAIFDQIAGIKEGDIIADARKLHSEEEHQAFIDRREENWDLRRQTREARITTEAEVERLNREKQELQAQIDELDNDREANQEKIAALQTQIDEKEQRLQNVTQLLQDLKDRKFTDTASIQQEMNRVHGDGWEQRYEPLQPYRDFIDTQIREDNTERMSLSQQLRMMRLEGSTPEEMQATRDRLDQLNQEISDNAIFRRDILSGAYDNATVDEVMRARYGDDYARFAAERGIAPAAAMTQDPNPVTVAGTDRPVVSAATLYGEPVAGTGLTTVAFNTAATNTPAVNDPAVDPALVNNSPATRPQVISL